MKGLNYETLEKPEEKEEEREKFTNEELEEKIGIILRLYEVEMVKKSIRMAQLNEFSYQLNKLFTKHCTTDKLREYFNRVFRNIQHVFDN